MTDADKLEKALGLKFKDKNLLVLAFVHSSYLNENPDSVPESNERLEFLGDAFIGLVVADELYRRYPLRPEGDLTPLRSAVVRGDTLAKVARSEGLGDLLQMGKGEVASGGRNRTSNLAATYEALVGAIFLDKGYKLACDFVMKTLAGEIEGLEDHRVPQNAKSILQEFVQSKGMAAPSYKIVETKGSDHAREFTAEVSVGGKPRGRGTGSRKSAAEREAAQSALEAMRD